MSKEKDFTKWYNSKAVDHVYTWSKDFKRSLNPFRYHKQLERSINMLKALYNTTKKDIQVRKTVDERLGNQIGSMKTEIGLLRSKLNESERLYKIDLAKANNRANAQYSKVEELRSRTTKAENQIKKLFAMQKENK